MKKILLHFQNLTYRRKLIWAWILVSLLPLSIMGIFCCYQTIHLLQKQELSSMNSALNTVSNTLDSQLELYYELITYLASSDEIVSTPFLNSSSLYDTYDHLNYHFDVFLKGIYTQHPEIEQITLYNAVSDLSHGQQLRPIADLKQYSWYDEDSVTPHPSWYLNDDGTLWVIQQIPNPFIKYIQSYSKNCIAIKISPHRFFQSLEDISTDYHLQISSASQILYDVTSDSVSNISHDPVVWTTLSGKTQQQGWKILLEKPTQMVFASIHQMAYIIIGIIFICIILIVLASGILSSFFVRRINHLHEQMQEVKKGNFSITIHDSCHDEIGELTENFHDMVEKINRLIQQDYLNKIQLKETQLKALQAQINPHFLYNCLSLINSKAIINQQPEISQMSQLLSTFYRTTLNKGKSETTLENEIKNVQSYIDIQLLLHDQAFDVIYQIDPALPNIKVPNLLLQPLVENSIIHGILPNKVRRGKLFLSITKVQQQILISVLDNGLGIPDEQLQQLLTTDSGGYGLKNVNERIHLSYGDGYGLTINSICGESTMITFCLPIS